ncbi:MAG: peptidoglycan-binding domain-containing protein [Myxococcota bacterium]
MHGHRTVDDVWQAEENAALREARPDPGVLAKGDVVAVPAAEPFEFHGLAVGRRHTLVVELPYPLLRLELAYANEAAIVGPDVTARVEFDGETLELQPDDTGTVEFEVGPFTEELELTVRNRTVTCSVATLEPVDGVPGIHDRLENLGYAPGGRRGRRVRDGVAFLSAVQEFQCDHGLKVDGDPGTNTQAKLLEVCGA